MKPRHYVEEIDPMEVNAGSQRRAKTRLEKPPEERPQSDMQVLKPGNPLDSQQRFSQGEDAKQKLPGELSEYL